MALLAVAAIAMTSCEPKNNPNNPGQGNNNSGNSGSKVTTVKAVIALGVSEELLQVADICIYDSITGETAKSETIDTFYSNAEPNTLGIIYAKFDSNEFAGATPYKGVLFHTTLRSDNTLGVRTEVKLKDNFIEILKTMKSESINLSAICGMGTEKALSEQGVSTELIHNDFNLSKLLPVLEENPERLNDHIQMINRMLNGTFYLAGEVVCKK